MEACVYTHRSRPGSTSPAQDPSASSSTSRPERPGPSQAHAAPHGLSRRTVPRREPVREGRDRGTQGAANRHRTPESPAPALPQGLLEKTVADCMDLPHGIHSDPPRSIKNMSAEHRTALEQVLTSRFPPEPPAREGTSLPEPPAQASHAMLMWLMVQSARLQNLSPRVSSDLMNEVRRQRQAIGVGRHDPTNAAGDPRVQYAEAAARAPFNSAHDAWTRPEYADALNNFLRYLDPSLSLHPTLRVQVESAFNHHRVAGRISPQVLAVVDELGLETLARERYALNPGTGHFKSQAQRTAERRGERFVRTPARPAENRPVPAGAPRDLNLNPHEALWMNEVLGLPSKPRSRVGKLPDSEQYQRIKSMHPEERNVLERDLEVLFTNQGDGRVSPAAENAVEAWLTTQQVRLRVHSEASIARHEQATRNLGTGVKLVAAKLMGAKTKSENERFHSEHESANRPEYATAVNNFMRLLEPSTRIHPTLRDRIADRFILYAQKEGTLSTQVLDVMKRVGGPKEMAAVAWRIEPLNNDAFSQLPMFVGNMNVMAVPTPFAPTPPRQR